jgi:uncharacterized RDD family membrane protein YckC
MPMTWYYLAGDKQVGPLPETEMRRLAETGSISDETLVWREGMQEWQPYRTVRSADPLTPRQPTACSQCHRPRTADDMVLIEDLWVCAECKPLFVQRMIEGVEPAPVVRYGGFWIRFLARVLDAVILAIVNSLFYLPIVTGIAGTLNGEDPQLFLGLQAILFALQFAVGVTYETVFIGKLGGTPGKLALSLRVVLPDGGKVTYMRALGRYFGTILSSLTLMIGYIIAAFDDQKRALHDHICNTRVIRV